VLQSFGFESPPDEQDTPSVPLQSSEAVRQFLATSRKTDELEKFDDVLGAIDPDDYEEDQPRQQTNFEGLVRSMQSGEPHRPLPDRQQQMMDFILTAGMESVLQEIQKTKTSPLPPLPEQRPPASAPPPQSLPEERKPAVTGSFQKLAKEEPPMPTLEDNGTVSDLLIGMHDSGFRDVLSLLGGQSIEDTQQTPISAPTDTEAKAFDDFFSAIDKTQNQPDEPVSPADRPSDFNFGYDDFEDEPTVAQVVLETTLDKTSKSGDFSIDELISDIEDRLTTHKLRVRPLPSWDMDTTGFNEAVGKGERKKSITPIKEPDFLPEQFPPGELIPPEMPPLETSEPVWTTHASQATLEEMQTLHDDAETVVEQPYVEEIHPAESRIIEPPATAGEAAFTPIPEPDESASAEGVWNWEIPEEIETETDSRLLPADDQWDNTVITSEADETHDVISEYVEALPAILEPSAETYVEQFTNEANELAVEQSAVDQSEAAPESWIPQSALMDEETRIAQLALNLTQASLELSAEGTILTRNNEVVAAAGDLSSEDTTELRDVIRNDWDASPEGARLRFITLPTSGKEYMLYSIQTDSDLVLSMIFAGTTPIRTIRQQGQRLAKALLTVPETTPPGSALLQSGETNQPQATKSVAETLEPYTYVWLVRDPERRLSRAVKQAITAGLSTQLREMHWQIATLDVTEDYVYLQADVPGETPSYTVVRDLKQRSAEIAHAQDQRLTPQLLWADSYLVLTPGRQLNTEEIQEFINFQRMM
jgi:REP element-mobilizing transposase RayT